MRKSCCCKGWKDWSGIIVNIAVWYFFIYYLLLSISGGTTLWKDSLILLILGCLGVMTCPCKKGKCCGPCCGASCKGSCKKGCCCKKCDKKQKDEEDKE